MKTLPLYRYVRVALAALTILVGVPREVCSVRYQDPSTPLITAERNMTFDKAKGRLVMDGEAIQLQPGDVVQVALTDVGGKAANREYTVAQYSQNFFWVDITRDGKDEIHTTSRQRLNHEVKAKLGAGITMVAGASGADEDLGKQKTFECVERPEITLRIESSCHLEVAGTVGGKPKEPTISHPNPKAKPEGGPELVSELEDKTTLFRVVVKIRRAGHK